MKKTTETGKYKITYMYFIFIVLLICPIIYSDEAIFGTVVHRTIFFWFGVDVLFFVFLLSKAKNEIVVKISTFQGVVLLNLLLTILSSLIGSVSFYHSMFGSFERMMGLISILHFVIFFLVLSGNKFSDQQWKWLFIILIVVGVISGLIGIITIEKQDDRRLTSNLANPMHASVYMLSLIFIVLSSFRRNTIKTNKKTKFVFVSLKIIIVLFFSIILFYTLTRAGILALIIGLTTALLLYGLVQSAYRKIVFSVLGSIFLLLFIIYINRTDKWVIENRILFKLTNLNLQADSIGSRIKLWKMVINNLAEKPILGWGQENFVYFYAKHYEPYLYDVGFWYDSAHNIFLDKLVITGIVGLFFFFAVFIVLILMIWNKKSELTLWEKSIFSGYLIAYLVFMSFGFESFISLFFFYGITIYLHQKSSPAKNAVIKVPNKIKFIVLFIGVLGSFFSIYQFVIKTYQANTLLTEAHKSRNLGDLVALYQEAEKTSLIGKFDALLQLSSKHIYLRDNKLITQQDKLFFKENVNSMYKKVESKYPNNPILLTQHGFVFWTCGDVKSAINIYEKVKNISPKRQNNIIALGNLYLNDNQPKQAFEHFEKAYLMDTSYHLPLFYMAYCKAVLREEQFVDKYLKMVSPKDVKENIHLVYTAYAINNRYADYFDYLLQVNPKDVFRLETYAYWAERGREQRDYRAVHAAVVSFLNHYLKNSSLKTVDRVMKKIMDTQPAEPIEKTFNELYEYRLSLNK